METDPAKALGRFLFPSDFVGFSGHFPGHPLLPAFAQVMVALHVVEKWKGSSPVMSSLERAKFRLEIHPDEEIFVEVREMKPGTFDARVATAEGLAASFIIKTI